MILGEHPICHDAGAGTAQAPEEDEREEEEARQRQRHRDHHAEGPPATGTQFWIHQPVYFTKISLCEQDKDEIFNVMIYTPIVILHMT